MSLPKDSTFIIAEAGVNHNGSVKLAKELVDIAVEAGADAVKFQLFKAENLVSPQAKLCDYQSQNDSSVSQWELLKKLELSFNEHQSLYEYCQQQKIQYLCTPFDRECADFLINSLRLSLIKIASGEISNALLLWTVARASCDVILSTGMSTLDEIEKALAILAQGYLLEKPPLTLNDCLSVYRSEETKKILSEKVTLLHCTTEYPAPPEDIHLRAMDVLQQAFSLPVGLSDHSLGISVSLAAVARGVTVIEKHFTLSRELKGPDHQASLEPDELKKLVQEIRVVEKALGKAEKKVALSEAK